MLLFFLKSRIISFDPVIKGCFVSMSFEIVEFPEKPGLIFLKGVVTRDSTVLQ